MGTSRGTTEIGSECAPPLREADRLRMLDSVFGWGSLAVIDDQDFLRDFLRFQFEA